jgi:hypothetical protein
MNKMENEKTTIDLADVNSDSLAAITNSHHTNFNGDSLAAINDYHHTNFNGISHLNTSSHWKYGQTHAQNMTQPNTFEDIAHLEKYISDIYLSKVMKNFSGTVDIVIINRHPAGGNSVLIGPGIENHLSALTNKIVMLEFDSNHYFMEKNQDDGLNESYFARDVKLPLEDLTESVKNLNIKLNISALYNSLRCMGGSRTSENSRFKLFFYDFKVLPDYLDLDYTPTVISAPYRIISTDYLNSNIINENEYLFYNSEDKLFSLTPAETERIRAELLAKLIDLFLINQSDEKEKYLTFKNGLSNTPANWGTMTTTTTTAPKLQTSIKNSIDKLAYDYDGQTINVII